MNCPKEPFETLILERPQTSKGKRLFNSTGKMSKVNLEDKLVKIGMRKPISAISRATNKNKPFQEKLDP